MVEAYGSSVLIAAISSTCFASKQACPLRNYLLAHLSIRTLLFTTRLKETAPGEGIYLCFCFLYIPGPQQCWLLSFHVRVPSCLPPQGWALLRTQVNFCHPPSYPSEESVVGRGYRLRVLLSVKTSAFSLTLLWTCLSSC